MKLKTEFRLSLVRLGRVLKIVQVLYPSPPTTITSAPRDIAKPKPIFPSQVRRPDLKLFIAYLDQNFGG